MTDSITRIFSAIDQANARRGDRTAEAIAAGRLLFDPLTQLIQTVMIRLRGDNSWNAISDSNHGSINGTTYDKSFRFEPRSQAVSPHSLFFRYDLSSGTSTIMSGDELLLDDLVENVPGSRRTNGGEVTLAPGFTEAAKLAIERMLIRFFASP